MRTEVITFDVFDFAYPYNAIFGLNTINKFAAVIHQGYLLMKIPTAAGVISVYDSQEEARRAERNTSVHNRQMHVIDEDEGGEVVPEAEQKPEAQMRQSMKQVEAERMKAVDDTRTVPLYADVPSRTVMIGTEVSKEEEDKLLQFLRHNQDVFAWSKSDLTGVHRSVIEHALDTDPKIKPKLQRQRPMSDDRVKSAEAKVQKLLDVRIIREVQYPVWVANVVIVLKKNGNMCMCIDFTELNKACPKDPYPLPRIDIIIDQVAGCEMLSLLDCFFGYHQVWMRREDEAKIGFTTPFGIFCFVKMPEGLRNVGPTFNRMMKLILGSQLGRNASAYVDDIVIMSEKENDYIADLTETFDNMRRNGLKLNLEKYIFGIRKGQLLGCKVSKRGIQANPKKIEALRRMQPPSNIKEVQRLTGRIASLNRFISKAAERSLPFFRVPRANSVFQWGVEQHQAFEDLKNYLEEAAVMTKPSPKAELLLYISATDTTVSAVLVEERMEADTLKQFPIYYVSEALSGSKLFYSKMEKMEYAVVMAKRKLRHYFQSHNI
jgi:hypothetical protein